MDAFDRSVDARPPTCGSWSASAASQLNGCAYCLDQHVGDAVAAGEGERRLATLAAWPESLFFTAHERAALALTERSP